VELASNPSCFIFFGALWNQLQIFGVEVVSRALKSPTSLNVDYLYIVGTMKKQHVQIVYIVGTMKKQHVQVVYIVGTMKKQHVQIVYI